MRPTGKLHLGHLAGALTNWIKLQDDYECIYGIVDWHALMSDYADSSKIRANCREVLLDWLSAGLDPDKCIICVQSHVPQHAELHLALSMITPLGWLQRCPTYKEQILNIQNKDLSNYAFLGYPVLMAADILLYKSHFVPVGVDQTAHLEISREMVRRFNHFYGDILVEPEILLTPTPKVPGTDGRKMSKSYGNSINISDSPEDMWEKLRTMKTDPAREKRKDPGTPEKCPVWDIHNVFNNDEAEKAEIHEGCMNAGIGCVDCKKKLREHVERVMAPIREKRAYFEKDEDLLTDILIQGAGKAKIIAQETVDQVVTAIGFVPRS